MTSETEKEMLEGALVCRNFNFSVMEGIAKKVGKRRIILTGMGSSVLFPAKQAKNRALKLGIANSVEAFFASDLLQYGSFSGTVIFLCSNSGETKEVIELLKHAGKRGAECVGVTARPGSTLAKMADELIVMSCGFEKGVASTKSVVEQGLIFDSLMFHLARLQGKDVNFARLKRGLQDAGKKMEANLRKKMGNSLVGKLAGAEPYFYVGLDNGVAEELTLKTHEIARKLAVFYPDTHMLHGVAEAISKGAIIVIDPARFRSDAGKFADVARKTGCCLLGLGEKTRGFEALEFGMNYAFRNYCLLSAGWMLLLNVTKRLGVDIDHPKKISKIGNPYGG